jgi:FkbM family methyltransferase
MSRLKKVIKRYGFFIGIGSYLKLQAGIDKIKLKGIKYPIHLRTRTSDSVLFKQIFYSGEYDIPISFEPRYIIDAGANIGFFSILLSNKFSDVEVVAIEPEESNFQMLKINTEGYKNIKAIKSAVWNKKTSLRLSREDFDKCAVKVEEVCSEQQGDIETVLIEDIISMSGFPCVDILKIDIEGAEKELFEKNYERWLPACRMLIIELHDFIKPGCSSALLKAVGRYDFSFFWVGENFCLINNDLKSINDIYTTA